MESSLLYLKGGCSGYLQRGLSLRKFFSYSVRDPSYLGLSLLGLHVVDAVRLSRFLGISSRRALDLYREALDLELLRHIKARYMLAERLSSVGGGLDLYLAPYLYTIVRVLRSKVVVETGVGPGVSTCFILLALERNGAGELFSIDLPETDQEIYISMGMAKEFYRYLPEGWTPRWLVLNRLKRRWHLVLGDSKRLLPKLLRDLGSIDMFLHNSLHTYEHMIFEYTIAWKHLTPEGILASYDVDWNSDFEDFCRAVGARRVIIKWRLRLASL
ncbi:MAG: class I SAM-dependent methyltransferase [Sulfolobales archaeon]